MWLTRQAWAMVSVATVWGVTAEVKVEIIRTVRLPLLLISGSSCENMLVRGCQILTDLLRIGRRTMSVDFAQLLELTVPQKLQLVEDLWDDIASATEELPVPAWQIEELGRRKANYLRNPGSGMSWEEAKRRIRSRHG